MNIRIQTYGESPSLSFIPFSVPGPMLLTVKPKDGTAVAALQKGLKDLQALSDTVAEEFIRAKEEFGRS